MSVRVVARIRPLLKLELQRDVILTTAPAGQEPTDSPTTVRIPNPKNPAENYSFQFNSVYDSGATQQELFEREIAPTAKHLYQGFDVTIFAYGVTGTGKTHTMRGGKSLADRGVIPRLLSNIYRRAKKVERDSGGATSVEVAMSYYEIYNDRVYDLFEAPEKRTVAGLPIRDNGGKSVVVGLTERPCSTLKDFEKLYDQANVNRSTSATKLNAHSSRSHAVLCVKLTQTTDSQSLISTASCIDLAGSEDNRRTDNNRERLVESASINKSLFVLAQCVEAISKKQQRIPYRESKMTRILSLGQNNGLTVMILNLSPLKSYHLDTLSSLNFANRTKKIEVNEIENEPIFRGLTTKATTTSSIGGGPALNRQPLRPLTIHNVSAPLEAAKRTDKPVKAFSVYQDKARLSNGRQTTTPAAHPKPAMGSHKRTYDTSFTTTQSTRPLKAQKPNPSTALSKAEIEALIEARVDAKLAERTLASNPSPARALRADLQARLDKLEARVAEREEDASTSEGLQYLLMAKQHQARGEETSALRMYRLARPHYPGNEKLGRKIDSLEERIRRRKEEAAPPPVAVERQYQISSTTVAHAFQRNNHQLHCDEDGDSDYAAPPSDHDHEDNDDSYYQATTSQKPRPRIHKPPSAHLPQGPPTPRTTALLTIINTRDVAQIRGLKGVGAKKAEAIVSALCEDVRDLEALSGVRGIGWKVVENMRGGLVV